MSNNKTILYLRTDLGSERLSAGGSVAHTLGVLNGFLSLNYSVICASSAMLDLLSGIAMNEFVVLANPSVLKFLRFKINGLLSNIFFTWQVAQLCKRHTVSMIYQRYSALNITGVLVKKIKKIPLVLEFNGSEVWVEQHWSPKGLFKGLWLYRFFEQYNLRHADYIVVVSQPLAHMLIAQGVDGNKILVNPNGVDVDVYNPHQLAAERVAIRKQLNIENKFVFGFIGSFNKWHGIEVLAQMIPAVIALKPQAHFLLIGAGPLLDFIKDELAGLIGTYVTFTGHIAQGQAKNYLAACDAYLSPTQPNPDGSRFFGSPTKLFEYLSMGKPVIVSDLEQLSEIVSPAFTVFQIKSDAVAQHVGICVDPLNPAAFITAACSLVDLDTQSCAQLGANGRQRVLAGYTWVQHTKKILMFTQQLG